MIRQNWSSEIVILTIKRLHKAGSRLDSSFVKKHHRNLLWAANRYIGRWEDAVEMAGIDYDSQRLTPKRLVWNKQSIIKEIQRLQAAENPVNSNHIQKSNQKLYRAACVHFGSWQKAIEAAGFDYARVRKQNPQPVSIERIVREIKKRIAEEKSVNGGAVSKEDSGLYGRAVRFFSGTDSWSRALLAAGVDPQSLSDPKVIWSKEVIVQTVQERFEQGEPLSRQFLAKNGLGGLCHAGERIFGSWQKTIEASGINYNDVRAKRASWKVEQVVAEIKLLVQNGNSLSMKSVRQIKRLDLLGAAINLFGSWGLAVEAAGFDYKLHCEVRSTKFWLSQLEASGYTTIVKMNRTRSVTTRKTGRLIKKKGT